MMKRRQSALSPAEAGSVLSSNRVSKLKKRSRPTTMAATTPILQQKQDETCDADDSSSCVIVCTGRNSNSNASNSIQEGQPCCKTASGQTVMATAHHARTRISTNRLNIHHLINSLSSTTLLAPSLFAGIAAPFNLPLSDVVHSKNEGKEKMSNFCSNGLIEGLFSDDFFKDCSKNYQTKTTGGQDQQSIKKTVSLPLSSVYHPIVGWIHFPSSANKNSCNSMTRLENISKEQQRQQEEEHIRRKIHYLHHQGDGIRFFRNDNKNINTETCGFKQLLQFPTIISTASSTMTRSNSDKQNDDSNIDTNKSLGILRIASNQGATIRTQCDIDSESSVCIGTLPLGVERYFVERVLLVADDDDNDDGEPPLVDVWRFKVRLLPCDIQQQQQQQHAENTSRRNNDHELYTNSSSRLKSEVQYGWISDKGRFANDLYTIAQIVHKNIV